MVFSACNRILNDSHLAEDATQEAFLLLAKKASSIKPDVIIGGWLYKSAVWEARRLDKSRARTAKRERTVAMEKEDSDTDNDKNLWEDICPHLDEALTSLPKRLEEAVVLCFLREKSRSEAAGILGCTENTLSKRISRGLHQLSRTFSKRGVTVPVATLATILASSTTDLKAAAVISSLSQSMVVPTAIIPAQAGATSIFSTITGITTKNALITMTGVVATAAGVALFYLSGDSESTAGNIDEIKFNQQNIADYTTTTDIDSLGENNIDSKSEPENNVIRSMIGHWGDSNGDVRLIVEMDGDQINISMRESDTLRREISDAKIVDESIHFISKSYFLNAPDHPFNGVACDYIVKMVDENRLELDLTNIDTPEPYILTRIGATPENSLQVQAIVPLNNRVSQQTRQKEKQDTRRSEDVIEADLRSERSSLIDSHCPVA